MNSFLAAFVTLFATVGVADIAFIFAALTKDETPAIGGCWRRAACWWRWRS